MARFGRTPLLDAMEMANEHIMVIAMMNIEGVMAIDDIAQVEGFVPDSRRCRNYRSHLASMANA